MRGSNASIAIVHEQRLRVSVVIAAYNAAEFLGRTLASVRAQTFINWELILVDDGSTDGTLALAERCAAEDARVKVIHCARNRGLPAARNAGIRASDPRGEFLSFLDADDLWDPAAMETLVATLDRYPAAVAAYGNARYIDASGNPICYGGRELEFRTRHREGLRGDSIVDWPMDTSTTFECFIYRNHAPVGAVLARRHAVLDAGMFDECLAACEDWDLWIRMSLRGAFVFVDQVLFYYRRHDRNISTDFHRMMEARVALRRKIIRLPGLNEQQHRLARFCEYLEYRERLGLDPPRERSRAEKAQGLVSGHADKALKLPMNADRRR